MGRGRGRLTRACDCLRARGGHAGAVDRGGEPLGRFAIESHLSVRRGYWFMPRAIGGLPIVELLNPFFPVWLQRLFIPLLLRVVIGPYSRYGLPEPDHKLWEHHPTINTELLQFIQLGEIKPHPDIRRFCGGKTVEFVDGTRHDFDLIVHATGYHVSFPILAEGMIQWTEVRAQERAGARLGAAPTHMFSVVVSSTAAHGGGGGGGFTATSGRVPVPGLAGRAGAAQCEEPVHLWRGPAAVWRWPDHHGRR